MRSRLPVLRGRRRYMIFELEAEGEIQPKDLMSEIHSAQFSLFGDAGASKNRLKLITFNGRYGLFRFSPYPYPGDTSDIWPRSIPFTESESLCIQKASREQSNPLQKSIYRRLSKISAENDGRRIELEEVSGCIIRTHGL